MADTPCCSNFHRGMHSASAATLRMCANSTSALDELSRLAGAGDGLLPDDFALKGRWLRPELQGGTMFSKRVKLSLWDWLKEAGTERAGVACALLGDSSRGDECDRSDISSRDAAKF